MVNLSGCPVDSATMIETMGLLLEGQLLDLNRYQQPSTVRPCLATALEHKCATADKVGYVCYGCISARFPVNRALFKHHPVGTEIPVPVRTRSSGCGAVTGGLRKIRMGMEVNRVEGDMEIQVELECGVVTDAWCSGTMYRGFEQILTGRDPADAW